MLVLVMLACLILGMGMPTSAAYLMAAILLIVPEKITDLIGLGLFAVLLAIQWTQRRRDST